MIPKSVTTRATKLIVLTGPLTSLAISPWFNFDPINPIKILVLSCLVALAFGLYIPYFGAFLHQVGRAPLITLCCFVLSLFSAFIFSHSDKAQQFWGVFGRGTGILSYLSLSILFLLTIFLASREFNKQIVYSFFVSTAFMTTYCLIQILELDPISWSAFFPFGTLGNVNFLSGYMGIALVSIGILAISKSISRKFRISLALLFGFGFFALYKSDSTQGFVALAVGIATYLVIQAWWVNRYLFLLAILSYISGFISLVSGLFDKGPLREFIFQFTVLFRADYMHAAIEMLLKFPLTGVGIDSYDDWYRSERGVISALRTSLDRTSNSAHNIALDLGAGGGFPLILSYFALVVLVFGSIVVGLKRGLAKDPFFMAIAMSWIAYQVQAAVSINQIGVGVWGWIFGGVLVGTVRNEMSKESLNRSKGLTVGKEKSRPNTPPPLAVISSVLSLSVAFLLSYLPLKTDSDYFGATRIGSAELIEEIAKRPTANSFLISKATTAILNAGLDERSQIVLNILNERFPRNLYGQLVQYERFSQTEVDRSETLARIREIDPFVAVCLEPNPELRLRSIIGGLPKRQTYSLARSWALVGPLPESDAREFTWIKVPQDALASKVASICRRS